MGHHLYPKINNSLSHVHSSAITFYLLISYSLQCSSSEGSLVPHSHTSAPALAFLPFDETPSSRPYRQVGLHQSFLESRLFHTFSVQTQCCSKRGLRALGGAGVGHISTPSTKLCTEARQLKVLHFLTLPWNCLHRGRGSSQAGVQTPLTITQ